MGFCLPEEMFQHILKVAGRFPGLANFHAFDSTGRGHFYQHEPSVGAHGVFTARLGDWFTFSGFKLDDEYLAKWKESLIDLRQFMKLDIPPSLESTSLRGKDDGFVMKPNDQDQDQQVNHESAMLGVEAGEAGKQDDVLREFIAKELEIQAEKVMVKCDEIILHGLMRGEDGKTASNTEQFVLHGLLDDDSDVEAGEAGKPNDELLRKAYKTGYKKGQFDKIIEAIVKAHNPVYVVGSGPISVEDAAKIAEALEKGNKQQQFDKTMADCKAEFFNTQLGVPAASGALSTQEGGSHYKDLAIQPVEYAHANKLDFLQGSVVKYVTRHKTKNGLQDIKKAIHFLQLIAELDYGVNLLEDDAHPVDGITAAPKPAGQVHDLGDLVDICLQVESKLGENALATLLDSCGYSLVIDVPSHDIDRVYSAAISLLVGHKK